MDRHTRTEMTTAPLADGPRPADAAVFLDFDGVLVDLAPRPDAIRVRPALPILLTRLVRATGGATAIVTGRALDDIAGHIPDLPDWVAGCHGGELRMPGRAPERHPLTGTAEVSEVQRKITALVAFGDGLIAEMKPLGAVIHYRAFPELGDALGRAAQAIAAEHPGFECHSAKMAYELRPIDVGKDRILSEWMERAPFAGRVPVYFGDDLTDEPALDWVRQAGGVSVKVGEGDTVAAHRVEGPSSVLKILDTWLLASDGA